MKTSDLSKLQYYIDTLPSKLNAFTEEEFAHKTAPDKWSKKELVGHLIDSATNNHHRFVRGQFEANPVISYAQNEWVLATSYQQMSQELVIDTWKMYNTFLLNLICTISPEILDKHMANGHTLSFLFADYVSHLEHHLEQIFEDFDFKA
ncbi:DinB family protein [Myroides marinus]|uniref:DinB family protein n=1 Tax=Myroides marinus TaxID=703342 RepID=UPI0025777F60|nr:DinB family protein [Myroides marinus]MDM1370115.1 DinB family protein [Myroides marinus]MDM1371168.1 DinB family protein [Myroides marinus]MDM1374052.1 DinB family protein [Myroides marinus]MDM1382682.1 DinB family protein [Myroides marinus]MDM1388525.1 DinB family protein [Myroides marinus]